MMESLDSGTASRSPTPDSGNSSGHSQSSSGSSKVTAVVTPGTGTNNIKGSDNNNLLNSNNNTPSSVNNNSNNKTSRDYNNRHSSGHGQYKKYGNHQNHHYGYGGHNVHYQRYNNGNGHRTYGNKHYHNSSSNYHHHNNHNHYQGQNYYQHSQQNHHHHNNSNNSNGSSNSHNGGGGSTNGGSNNSHHHQYHSNHHNGNNHVSQTQQTQYYNSNSVPGSVPPHHNHHQHNSNNNSHSHQHHHHHRNAPPPQPPQVFISSDSVVEPFTWPPPRRGGGSGGGDTTSSSNSNTNWSSPNLVDAVGGGGGDTSSSTSSAVQISLNLSALKQGIYSPSPQNASPATSPATTTDSSDAYSLQDDGGSTTGTTSLGSSTNGLPTNNGVRHNNFSSNLNLSSSCVDSNGMHYTTGGGTTLLDTTSSSLNGGTTSSSGPSPVNSGNMPGGFTYAQFHPNTGFYTYPGTGHHHHLGGGRTFSHPHHHHHHHHQLISQNLGLLIPADSSFSMGKADSSISSGSSEKTLEWSDDGTGTLVSCSSTASSDRGDEYGSCTVSSSHADSWCATQEYYYAPYITAAATPTPFTTPNKKRLYNGTGPPAGKLTQAVRNQRFHHYPRKMGYQLPGFPREWFDDLDPEEYVRAFSKFGEVKERPTALSQNPQNDSLSEGIWLKFVANQQTTETFRKKMELWRDVYRIVRSLNYNSHFKHDPRNFPSFGLQVVGSTMSGFGSNTSDVDMCLLVRSSDVDQRYEAVDKLQVLYGALSGTQWLDNVELIYAKVPILKFRDPKRSLEVDLNCNNFVGIRNTHLLYCYSQADWRLKPLVLVVKLWAHYHGINDAKNMTISSYSLVLMVIHFLQCGVDEPVLPNLQDRYPDKFSNTSNILNVKINEVLPSWASKNKESIGNLLIQFLEYYAKNFDYAENAVSIRTGRTIPIKVAAAHKCLKNDPHQWKYLCIEEPFDRTNTARSVYDRDTFDKIIGIFKLSFERLQVSRNLESIFTPISESDICAISSSVLIR